MQVVFPSTTGSAYDPASASHACDASQLTVISVAALRSQKALSLDCSHIKNLRIIAMLNDLA